MATTDEPGQLQAQHFVMCENCKGPVEFTCIRCIMNFCGECSLKHMRTKSKRGHEVRAYSCNATQQCGLHPPSICEFYCKSCSAPLCTECVSTNAHKLHDLSSISSIVAFFEKLTSEECWELRTKVKGKFEKRIKDLERSITEVAQHCAIARRSVTHWGEKMHREIDILIESLHQEIKAAGDGAARILIEQKNLMESKISDIEDALKKNEDILKSENSKDIVKFQSKIDQLSELPSLKIIQLPEFVPPSAKIKSNVRGLFGEVKLFVYHAEKNFANPTLSRTANEIYSDVIQQHGDLFNVQEDRDMSRTFSAQEDRNMSRTFSAQEDRNVSRTVSAQKDRDMSRNFNAQEDRNIPRTVSAQEDRDMLREQLSSLRVQECKVHIHPKLLLCLLKVMPFREKVEKFLKDLKVRPVWSKSKRDDEEAFLILEGINVTADLDEIWKKSVRHALGKFLNEWEVNSFNVSEHLWDKMMEMLQTVWIPNPENIVCQADRKQRQIFVVGKAGDAMEFTMTIQKALWDMDDTHR